MDAKLTLTSPVTQSVLAWPRKLLEDPAMIEDPSRRRLSATTLVDAGLLRC